MASVGASSADKKGCPNANSANGASHANDKSAHGADKQSDRTAPPASPTDGATPAAVRFHANQPEPTPEPTPAPTPEPTPVPTPNPQRRHRATPTRHRNRRRSPRRRPRPLLHQCPRWMSKSCRRAQRGCHGAVGIPFLLTARRTCATTHRSARHRRYDFHPCSAGRLQRHDGHRHGPEHAPSCRSKRVSQPQLDGHVH